MVVFNEISSFYFKNLFFKDGATPLFVASQNGHINIVKYLLSKGAQVNQQRIVSKTCYSMALLFFLTYLPFLDQRIHSHHPFLFLLFVVSVTGRVFINRSCLSVYHHLLISWKLVILGAPV